MGTATGVIATILVNGVAIQTILISPARQGEEGQEGEEEQPARQYFFDIRTEGGRSSLMANGQDSVWIYASVRCTDPEVDCGPLTAGIGFSPGGSNWDWLQMGGADYSGGMKAVQVLAMAQGGARAAGSASMVVTAEVEGQSLHAELPFALSVLAGDWEVVSEPAEPGPLVPDSNQVFTLMARVRFDASAYPPDQAQLVLQETMDNMRFGGGEWLDLSDPPTPMGDGFMAVSVAASDPSGEPMRSTRPESAGVRISTTCNGEPMETSYAVRLAQKPEIEISPEKVDILAGSGDSFDVAVTLTNPGPNSWTFDTRFGNNDKAICNHSIVKDGPDRATVTLSDSGALDQSGLAHSWVTVVATDDVTGVEITRGIRVAVLAQGLLISDGLHQDGTLHVRADGKQQRAKVTFKLIAWDPQTKAMVSGTGGLEDLEFELQEEPGSQSYNALHYCGTTRKCDIVRDGTPPIADYSFVTEKELPGEDRITVNYQVSVPGYSGDEFTRRLAVTIEVMTLEEESEGKELEYQRCREVIRKYIPTEFQQKFYELVDQKKDKLGPKGLAKLRRKIWSIAVNFILAEGDQAYKGMEEWADRIVTVLEYAQSAGDIAFNAAATALCGPYGAMAAGLIKGAIVSAIQCYESGQDVGTWAEQNVWSLVNIVEGQVVDVDVFEKALGGNRAKAWAYYVAVTFVLTLYRQQEIDFYQAAKETAQSLAMEKFSSWLGQQCKASLDKHGIKVKGPGGSETTIVKPAAGDGPTVKAKPGDDGPAQKPKPGDDGSTAKTKAGDDGPTAKTKPGEDGPGQKPKPGAEDASRKPESGDEGASRKPQTGSDAPDAKKPVPPAPDAPDAGGKKSASGDDAPGKKPDESGKKPDQSEGKKEPDQEKKEPQKEKKTEKKEPAKEKKPTKEERDKAWQEGRAQARKKIQNLNDALKSGDPERIRNASMEFLKDKNAMMEINRDPGAGYQRQKLNQALKQHYAKVDQQVIKDLGEKYQGDEIRIFNASNPKKSTASEKSSYDRDITAQRKARPGELVADPNSPSGFRKVKEGETAWVDVPAKDLESVYSKHFYGEANNIPPDKRGSVDPQKASEFSKQYDQTCTDRLSSDSYGRYNKDLRTAISKPGQKFTDSGQIAGVMEYKANEWYEKADHIQHTDPVAAEGYRAEGMRQTSKQWNNQAVRRAEAMRSQGKEVQIPKKLDAAMQEMKNVESGKISPAEAEARIKKLGYDSVQQVGHDMGKYVEMLDKLRP